MGSQQVLQTYPPEGEWKCPGCDKKHSKPHYSVEGQIDYTKKPGEPGRIRFNRRKAWNDSLASDTPIDHSKPMKGDQLDDERYQRPLFCPHRFGSKEKIGLGFPCQLPSLFPVEVCGWEDEFIIIVRTGDAPDLIERFLKARKVSGHKTLREYFQEFFNWLKEEAYV